MKSIIKFFKELFNKPKAVDAPYKVEAVAKPKRVRKPAIKAPKKQAIKTPKK